MTPTRDMPRDTMTIPRLYFIRHVVTGRLAEGLDRRPLSWPSREQARAYLDAQRPERADTGVATWADMHELASVIVGEAAAGGDETP